MRLELTADQEAWQAEAAAFAASHIAPEAARIDEWLKDVTPSNELRKWYHADPEGRRAEFAERYDAELAGAEQQAALQRLRNLAKEGPVTLVTSAKALEHCHVPVLARHLGTR